MDTTDDPSGQPKPQDKAYEDPHFHDDDLEPPEESDHKAPRGPNQRKPARRIPPPPRRRPDDD